MVHARDILADPITPWNTIQHSIVGCCRLASQGVAGSKLYCVSRLFVFYLYVSDLNEFGLTRVTAEIKWGTAKCNPTGYHSESSVPALTKNKFTLACITHKPRHDINESNVFVHNFIFMAE